MGLFDNLLKAVEDGSIEKALGGAVDKLESGLDKAIDKAEKTAVNLEEQSKKIDRAAEKLQNNT